MTISHSGLLFGPSCILAYAVKSWICLLVYSSSLGSAQ